MSIDRRNFLRRATALAGGVGIGWGWQQALATSNFTGAGDKISPSEVTGSSTMVSTWNHGTPANIAGFEALAKGGSALDMIEAGARIVEADPSGQSVGLGGLPDRDGLVTLDACIMDHMLNAGSVCFVQNVAHPLSLARQVMENTPHVMLAGAGAEQYARELNMPKTSLLTAASKKAWEQWRLESNYAPVINIENHDTIGLIALDDQGRLAGGCTTSGVAYKMHGRVGDSPIIGSGLYVDGTAGGATATGLGEAVMKTVGSFLVVELMKQGAKAQEACEEAVHRIMKAMPVKDLQVGYLALGLDGSVGGHAIHSGFNYALHRPDSTGSENITGQLIDASHG